MILLLEACLRLAPTCEAIGEGFVDADGDGVGVGDPVTGCLENLAAVGEDCDDENADAFPGAEERWYDGVDQDCDGRDDDQDDDGFAVAVDCDDTDAAVYPDAADEWYDGTDSDCDGANDYDQDGDGSPQAADCDDLDATRHPGAEETWYDGVDTDCGGEDDYDQDGDGFTVDADCNDEAAAANPDGVEICDGLDNDCSGGVDEGFDFDGDGYAGCADDCDDDDPTVNPGATETCDGVDQDCDTVADEDFDTDADGWATCAGDCDDADVGVNPGAEETWYDDVDQDCAGDDDFDQDGDGHDLDDDCADTDATVHPGAAEVWYDDIDQDCAGDDDFDQDADGYTVDTDCDDTRKSVYPGATDAWYDGVDSNCDGASDYDKDADGYDLGDDCDDTKSSVHPGATDTWYDGVDSDCDGASDYDQDADGWDLDDDCDDTDASYAPDAPDVLDGNDQDCDGTDDNPAAEDVAIAIILGDETDQHAGEGGVLFTDDADGDGEDELVTASPDDGTDAGAVWLFGWSDMAGEGTVGDAWLTLLGATGDELGAAIHGGVDWNDDGEVDLLIGAPGRSVAYLAEPDDATSATQAASSLAYATLTGDTGARFGAAVASGDIDSDGVDDVILGAPGTSKGTVYVFLGATGAAGTADADYAFAGADAGDAAGSVLASGGDTNADGYDDFAVGIPGDDENSRSDSGSVLLVQGGLLLTDALGLEFAADWTLTGSAASQAVGGSLAMETVASTASADVLVGASGYSGGGAVGLFHGTMSGTESFPAADRLLTGAAASVSGGTDLDDDGTDDAIVGGSDVAWLVSLSGSATIALATGSAASWSGDSVGSAVEARARDFDGDGIVDVAVAASDGVGAIYLLGTLP